MARPPSQPRFPAIRTIGLERRPFDDVYHQVLIRPWWQFFALVVGTFLGANAVFALFYRASPDCIVGVASFEDAFFFSVQTLGTIGYGGMSPVTRFGHIIVTIEAITGIVGVALVTGLTFAKFAHPRAKVLFSSRIAAPTRHGVPHLQFRMANTRQNLVVEATLRVIILVQETTPEGETLRRPIDLKLVRPSSPLFSLTWTAMHTIDESSPFHGEGAIERLRALKAEIFLGLTGYDDTVAQTIHARYRYTLDDIAWGMRFHDVTETLPDGTRVIDYRYFHDMVEARAPHPTAD
jgi:inward rectifier potassium channel